jgi:hypothetical protein
LGTIGNGATPPQQIYLWNQNVPNALGTEEKDKPKITVWFPDAGKSVGTAVVICPGGGYGALAMDHEGKQIAEWLNLSENELIVNKI